MQRVRQSDRCDPVTKTNFQSGFGNSSDQENGVTRFTDSQRDDRARGLSIHSIHKGEEVALEDNNQISWVTTNSVWSMAQKTRAEGAAQAMRRFSAAVMGTIRATQIILVGISRLTINSLRKSKPIYRR